MDGNLCKTCKFHVMNGRNVILNNVLSVATFTILNHPTQRLANFLSKCVRRVLLLTLFLLLILKIHELLSKLC